MKICILTQPLHNNYGGILQNYALQKVLKDMGHVPITIDYVGHRPSYLRILLSGSKTVLLRCIGKKRPFLEQSIRNKPNRKFVKKYINMTKSVSCYSRELVEKIGADAVIVGSDQVWRVRYNKETIDDMYLKFLGDLPVKRIAYAASFGVDNMQEYTERQIVVYGELLKQFDLVTVREDSGVELCKKYFGVIAEHVLDPTLLLNKDDYLKICMNIPINKTKFLAAYILDNSIEKQSIINSIAKEKNLEIVYCLPDEGKYLPIENWLSLFRDAEFVITDSFHGTVFSIIFNKEFLPIMNQRRGNTRFDSILSTFNIDQSVLNSNIDWDKVNNIRRKKQVISHKLLTDSLRNAK